MIGIHRQGQPVEAALHQDSEQAQFRSGANDHVAAIGARPAVADDGHLVGLKLSFVEQFVVGGDPLGQSVRVVESSSYRLVLQRNPSRGKETGIGRRIGPAGYGANCPDILPAGGGLPRTSQERG